MGYQMVEDAGRGYRRVVASPKPVDVAEKATVKALVDHGHVVISVGGGGIPVVVEGNKLVGVAAVIDKDFASAKLAEILDAEDNTEEYVSVSKSSSLYKNSSDASTMTYPDHEYGKTGFLNTFSFNKTRSKYTLNDKKILTTDLINYSSKLYNLLENINKNDRGNVFIYSNYVNYGGTSLLRQLFLNNGFFEFSNKNMPETKHYKSFTVFDESTSLRDRENFKRIFNNFGEMTIECWLS